MKRIHRAAQLALAATAAASTLAPAVASAQTAALTMDLSQGLAMAAPVGNVDGKALMNVAVGLAKSADAVLNEGILPEVNHTGDSINIVLDPRIIPELAQVLAPAAPGQLTIQEGRTAAGAKVVFPTTGTYTSGYGQRWGSMHNGIDVANPVGTPIYAVMDGEVISSGPAQGYGNWVRILHDDGSISVYGHMAADSILVGVGERVAAGQQIAGIGNEGRSTGPHLHFEIWPDGANAVDPQAWFAEQGIYF